MQLHRKVCCPGVAKDYLNYSAISLGSHENQAKEHFGSFTWVLVTVMCLLLKWTGFTKTGRVKCSK